MPILNFIDNHTGLIAWFIVGLILLVLYLRGETAGLFPFLRETLSERDPKTGQPIASTKRMTLLASTWVLLWGYMKLTLAVCRWIDKGGDPTTIYGMVSLGVMGLAGITYLGGKWLSKSLPTGLIPDSDTDAKA